MSDENTKVADEKIEEGEKEKQEIILINEETIQSKIYIVRGQKVMLDFELAEIYGYTTKRFNKQVKNIMIDILYWIITRNRKKSFTVIHPLRMVVCELVP